MDFLHSKKTEILDPSQTPFRVVGSAGKEEGRFTGGYILPIKSKEYKEKTPSNRESFKDIGKEIYLKIECEPLSNIIKLIEFKDFDEVKEERLLKDNLLAFFLPVYSPDKENRHFNGNFNFVRSNYENPLAGEFDSDKVYLNCCLIKSPEGIVSSFQKKTSIEIEEGECLFLSVKVTIKQINGNFVFNLGDLKFINKSPSGGSFSNYEFSGEEELEDKTISLECDYPLGVVEEGNFITGRQGNPVLRFLKKEFLYFDGTEGAGNIEYPSCELPKYSKRIVYSLSPYFT